MLGVTNKPIILSVFMLSLIMLSVIILSVVMLNVVMLNVVAPAKTTHPNEEVNRTEFSTSVRVPWKYSQRTSLMQPRLKAGHCWT
jgi:hypothetical protein